MAGRLWRPLRDGLVRFRWPLAGLTASVIVLACILVIPQWLVGWELGTMAPTLTATDKAKAINDVRATLLQGIGGAVLLLGAYFTYRQLEVARQQAKATAKQAGDQLEVARQQAQATATQARDQLAIAQQGQVTERFTRAIDQLGHTELDVRLGGIYALERIANDSPDDRATIAEVLTAFVRGHAPWPPRLPGQYVAEVPIKQVPELQVRAPDVQAVLTVLARRQPAPKLSDRLDLFATDLRKAILNGATLQEANLAYANLQEAHLARANLQGADLRGANLQGATLDHADLRNAKLLNRSVQEAPEHANLQHAHLDQANLQGTRLFGINLQEAHLARANLQGADLRGAKFQGATLDGADLRNATLQEWWWGPADFRGASLVHANLQGATLHERAGNLRLIFQDATLTNANLQDAHLAHANLQRAKLNSATLQGARLTGADLQSARLSDANLQGVDLRGANLQGARLDNANLQQAKLEGAALKTARADPRTRWPTGFNPGGAGVV